MKSVHLDRYRSHLKKVAEARARNEQLDAVRRQRFRASLVDDPLAPSEDIAEAIDRARRRK